MTTTTMTPTTRTRVSEIYDVVEMPLVRSLLVNHPNDVGLWSEPPVEWATWWDWAIDGDGDGEGDDDGDDDDGRWRALLEYYARPPDARFPFEIPHDLSVLIDAVRALQLPRTPTAFTATTTATHGRAPPGMSPKKAHEVAQMSAFVRVHLTGAHGHGRHGEHDDHDDHDHDDGQDDRVTHVVDIGAGQGHLSRELHAHGLHVLALDRSVAQTAGAHDHSSKATRRQRPPPPPPPSSSPPPSPGSLTHLTVDVRPDTLAPAITAWIRGPLTGRDPPSSPPKTGLVALHACGSLTVDILRAFIAQCRRGDDGGWIARTLVVVGCCYNLLSQGDWPLSTSLRTRVPPVTPLPTAALHLATQVPAQWFRSERATRSSCLALRKVVYRALLQPALHADEPRLGRLNDASYADWPTFLARASARLHVDHARLATGKTRHRLERRLEVLHVLRCILGPLVETLVLLDRLEWMREELPRSMVELVNLFDQAMGSARNVALVVKA